MYIELKNKKVLITGASGGIGKAISEKFINLGCSIIFTSSSKNKLIDLRSSYGDSHAYYLMDLIDSDSIKSAI